MVKKSLIWLYSFTTYLLWGVIILVTSIVLGLRYYLLPHVKDYREAIATHASAAIGQRVTIGNISAGWNGLNPHFDLYKISIFDSENRPALEFDHIDASLSWLSLIVGEPRLDNLTVREPRLTIRRETDGTIYVAGISLNGPSQPAFPNWLLRQQEIVVTDAALIWQDDMRHAPALSLDKLNLLIERPFSRSLMGYHRFGLTAIPSVAGSMPIDIRGSIYGEDVAKAAEWHGQIYAATQGTDISAWRTWLKLPAAFQQGNGALRMWLDFADNALEQATADVSLTNVVTRFDENKPVLALRQLSGRLQWQQLDKGGYKAAASQLVLDAENGLKLRNGSLQWQNAGVTGITTGEVKLDTLPLEPMLALAEYLPVREADRNMLATLAPTGALEKLNLRWQSRRDQLEKYTLRSSFNNLGIQPYEDIPGFNKVSGIVDANELGGKLSINASQATLDLRKVFRKPIPADKLTAQIGWKKDRDNLEVTVSNLLITNPHLTGNIIASYRYDGKKSGYIDLTGNIRNADAKYASMYYPMVIGKDTLHWLDTSIFGGRSDDVKVRLKGYLDDFPYIGGKTGEFSVTANIRDGIVDYGNDWPKIEGLQLKMKFYENKMLLSEAQGHVLGTQLTNTSVRINDLDAEHPVLEIDGRGQGSVQDGLRFIEHSPIRDAINHFTDGTKGTGTGKLTLKLSIPLDNVNAAKVNGSYTVANASLEDDEFGMIDHINGRLDFTESSIKADRVQAQMFGGPLSFNLASGSNGRVDIRARGRISNTGLRQIVSNPAVDRLFGSTEWRGQITMQNKHSDFVIDLPDMLGMASTLPYPLDKPTDTRAPLHIERRLTSDGDAIAITYGVADRAISAKISRSQKNGVTTLDRADVRFAGDTHPTNMARGITLGGTLAKLDVDQWLSVFSKRSDIVPNANAKLKIAALDIFGKRLNDIQLDAKADGGVWKSSVKSREISGDITWLPQGHGQIIAKLDSLVVPEAAPAKLTDIDDTSTAKPQDYPSINLTANQFQARGKNLGKLELRASQEGSNWNIETLRVENPDFMVEMSGAWQNWRRRATTRLNINMEVADLGNTLERFGYPGAIKDSTATLKGTLSWPDGPQAFTPAALNGNFSLNVTKGQFLKIQPGVGRLLGIVSLQSLPRRLLLDFRDIFSDGFAYDKISGDVRINQGIMRSDNFAMKGVTAEVEMSGETNLAKETQNLHVKVTPSVSDSFSLAAFAGGPAVGVAAFVAQKLLKDPLNQIASYEYDIVGTWDDPKEVKSDTPGPAQPATSPLGQ